MLVVLVFKFLEVGGLVDCHVPVLVGDHKVKADVFFRVSFSLCQFVVLDVLYDLSRPHQLRDSKHLIDIVVALYKWDFPEYLRSSESYHGSQDHASSPAVNSVVIEGVTE